MTGAAAIRHVAPETPAHACLEILAHEDIRHLPVMHPAAAAPSPAAGGGGDDAPKLLAVLSMRDLLGRFLVRPVG